jgi:hypothetical protein
MFVNLNIPDFDFSWLVSTNQDETTWLENLLSSYFADDSQLSQAVKLLHCHVLDSRQTIFNIVWRKSSTLLQHKISIPVFSCAIHIVLIVLI